MGSGRSPGRRSKLVTHIESRWRGSRSREGERGGAAAGIKTPFAKAGLGDSADPPGDERVANNDGRGRTDRVAFAGPGRDHGESADQAMTLSCRSASRESVPC